MPNSFPMRARALVLCLATASLAGCASDRGHDRAPPGCAATDLLGQHLSVPSGADMGQCRAAVDRWFAQVDSNHDGRLSAAEVESWTHAVFVAVDTDHDGVITSPEADAARPGGAALPLPPDQGQTPPPGQTSQGHHRHGAGPGGPGGNSAGGGQGGLARTSALMAADADLDFRVTEAELQAFARAALQRLDSDHDGMLSEEEARTGLALVRERGNGGGRSGGGGGGGHRRHGPGAG